MSNEFKAMSVEQQQELESQQEAEHKYSEEVFQIAFLCGAIAFIITALIAGIGAFNYQGLPAEIPFYDDFDDWIASDDNPSRFGNPLEEIAGATLALFQGVFTLKPHIAGIAREFSLVSVVVFALFTYRSKLAQRYEIRERFAQLNDFKNESWAILARILYLLAAFIGSYVVFSVLLYLIASMFKDLSLNVLSAVLIIALFTGVATGASTYFAIAVSTHELFLLGIGGWVLGLGLSFNLARPLINVDESIIISSQWWCEAISSAGEQLPSRPIFTAAFLCVIVVIGALWLDIDSLVKLVIEDIRKKRPDSGNKFIRDNAYLIVRLLLLFVMLGLAGVAFVRTETGLTLNAIFHTGGIVLAVVCIGILSFMIPSGYFHPLYRSYSRLSFGMIFFLGLVYIYSSFTTPLPSCKGGVFSLTALEFCSLFLVVCWIYITLDNILSYANIHLINKAGTK